MTDPSRDRDEHEGESRPVIRDRRRLDPVTGDVRDQADDAAQPGGEADTATSGAPASPRGTAQPVGKHSAEADVPLTADEIPSTDAALASAQAEAAERLADLQRLQAEYVNYRRRVDRDRAVARDGAVAEVLESLLPVLDDVHLSRQHGDLDSGPFAAIAEKLETVLSRYGLTRYGESGEEFDPAIHEALIHSQAEPTEDVTTTTVVQVLQPGYRAGEKVLRAARVAVSGPAG
jgi:molecular chaperone GrpE